MNGNEPVSIKSITYVGTWFVVSALALVAVVWGLLGVFVL